jgi:ubiquitin-protein ligase
MVWEFIIRTGLLIPVPNLSSLKEGSLPEEVKSLDTGDLLFFSGGSFVEKSIQTYTRSPWNHVALVYNEGGVVYLIESDIQAGYRKGPRLSRLEEKILDWNGTYMGVRKRLIPLQNPRGLLDVAIMKMDYDFDSSMISWLFDAKIWKDFWKPPRSYFCSEFVASVLMDSHTIPSLKPASSYSPADLAAPTLVSFIVTPNLPQDGSNLSQRGWGPVKTFRRSSFLLNSSFFPSPITKTAFLKVTSSTSKSRSFRKSEHWLMKRIKTEIEALQSLRVEDEVVVQDVDLEADGERRVISLSLKGPKDSFLEGGTFLLKVSLSEDYPFSAPDVQFMTKMFHPNISSKGEVCLGLDKWSPSNTIKQRIIVPIIEYMMTPDIQNPLNAEAAKLFMEDPTSFGKRVKKYVKSYAS